MMDLYKKYKLRHVINAYDKGTHLGGARVAPEVAKAVAAALQDCYHMDDINAAAGHALAKATGAEWGCVTACAAAGITLGAAAAMTGSDLGKIAQLPDTAGMPNRIILQKGHAVNFGAPATQMLKLSGAEVVEVGNANGCRPWHIEHALAQGNVAAVFAVESYHTARYSGLQLNELAELAHQANVPVIVDASTQELRLRELVRMGLDLIVCSAHKYFSAPTAGVVVGRKGPVEALLMQNAGIGRSMKVGKEGILGLLAAMAHKPWADIDEWAASEDKKIRRLAELLKEIPDTETELSPDPNGCPIKRVRIEPSDSKKATAKELRDILLAHDPSIVVRVYGYDPNAIYINVTEMNEEEIEEAGPIIRSVIANRV